MRAARFLPVTKRDNFSFQEVRGERGKSKDPGNSDFCDKSDSSLFDIWREKSFLLNPLFMVTVLLFCQHPLESKKKSNKYLKTKPTKKITYSQQKVVSFEVLKNYLKCYFLLNRSFR